MSFDGLPNETLQDRVTFIVLELPPSMPNRRWGAKPPTVLKNTLDYPHDMSQITFNKSKSFKSACRVFWVGGGGNMRQTVHITLY